MKFQFEKLYFTIEITDFTKLASATTWIANYYKYQYHVKKQQRQLHCEKTIKKTPGLLSAQAPNGQYGCAVWVRRNDQRKLHNCQALLPLARLPVSGAGKEN